MRFLVAALIALMVFGVFDLFGGGYGVRGLESHTTYRVSVGLVVVIGRVDVGRIEVQIVGVGAIVGGR